jgi:enoyl-CoA hydratase/carnithine racemase
MAKSNYLKVSNENKILIIKIDNPPNNYLSTEFFSELKPCYDIMLSHEVDAVVFTGAGRVFSKGADVNELNSVPPKVDLQKLIDGNETYSLISRFHKPVIAAINGACFGGGLELALACHLRVCSEKARLGLPEVSIGVIPGLGGIQRLIRVVGEAKALEMILLGDMISASRAYELNLVSRVFPKKDFLGSVISFVRALLAARREAIEEVLRLVALSRPASEDDNILTSAERFMRLVSQGGL